MRREGRQAELLQGAAGPGARGADARARGAAGGAASGARGAAGAARPGSLRGGLKGTGARGRRGPSAPRPSAGPGARGRWLCGTPGPGEAAAEDARCTGSRTPAGGAPGFWGAPGRGRAAAGGAEAERCRPSGPTGGAGLPGRGCSPGGSRVPGSSRWLLQRLVLWPRPTGHPGDAPAAAASPRALLRDPLLVGRDGRRLGPQRVQGAGKGSGETLRKVVKGEEVRNK